MKDNKGDQKGRRAARRANYESQGNESAADFNFDQLGKGHVSGQEIRHLRKSGQSKEDIMAAARSSGGEIGRNAERMFSRWEAKAKAKASSGQADAEAIDPNQPANEQSQNTNIENTQEQTVVQDNDQTSTVVGDNNTVDQNQDNSVDQMGGNNKSAIEQASTGGDQMDHFASGNAAAEADKLKNSYIDTIRPGTTSEMDTAIKNTQQQDISQNNDQTSTITGDNNTVWQQQDNSIRQYGGDNRSFVYQGGNSGVDTPVSAATMSGFYDVDDSPGATAAFNDLHTTLNNDAQKKYSGAGMRIAGMFSNFDARGFDPAALQGKIDASTERSYDKATTKNAEVFGDPDLYRNMSEYKFGAEPKTVDYDKDDDDDE